jgi:hypothetical protein
MGKQRDRYSAFFEKRRGKRNHADEASLLKAADAFDRAEVSGELRSDDLAVIVETASHPHMMQWSNATDLLGKLSTRFETAANAIAEMSDRGFASRGARIPPCYQRPPQPPRSMTSPTA